MRNSKGNGLSILLIALGVLMLLGVFGPLLGWVTSLILPIAMVALGYYGIRKGNAFFGWLFMIIGVIALIGKLSWLIGPILGAALIVYGVSRFKGNNRRYY